jgi:3'(2'), 5'-bisphosphate nucleotidase
VFNKETKVAVQCAVAASRICESLQSRSRPQRTVLKADQSPVSAADYASQAIICRILNEAFPTHPIVAEESPRILNEGPHSDVLTEVLEEVRGVFPDASGERVREWIGLSTKRIASRYWCVDPVDGTKGFLRGRQYAIALAFVVDGEVQVGVLACPNLPDPKISTNRTVLVVRFSLPVEERARIGWI